MSRHEYYNFVLGWPVEFLIGAGLLLWAIRERQIFTGLIGFGLLAWSMYGLVQIVLPGPPRSAPPKPKGPTEHG